MNKIKVIDLLNMISKGEEVPKKIKYKNEIYTYDEFSVGYGENYFDAEWKKEKGYRVNKNNTFKYLCVRDYCLHDKVEILEEEPRDIEVCGSLFTKSEYDKLAQSEEEKKIPEKLNITYEKNCKNNYKLKCEGYNISTPQKLIADKVNYIIDYLKSKGE